MCEIEAISAVPRVLVVEDNIDLGRHLAILVEQCGATCFLARNESKAMEAIDSGEYSAIIADVNLSEGGGSKRGGIVLAERLEQRGLRVPVILISYDPWFWLPAEGTSEFREMARRYCLYSVLDRNDTSFNEELSKRVLSIIDEEWSGTDDES